MFASMLGGIGFKLALLAVLATAIGAAYWHYTVVKGERDAALMQIGSLQVVTEDQRTTIRDQETAIGNWATAQARMQKTLDDLAAAQIKANTTARKLNGILAKHDLHALSLAKPGLIEQRINKGTVSILEMFKAESR